MKFTLERELQALGSGANGLVSRIRKEQEHHQKGCKTGNSLKVRRIIGKKFQGIWRQKSKLNWKQNKNKQKVWGEKLRIQKETWRETDKDIQRYRPAQRYLSGNSHEDSMQKETKMSSAFKGHLKERKQRERDRPKRKMICHDSFWIPPRWNGRYVTQQLQMPSTLHCNQPSNSN